jgi:hypothetical protein
MLFKSIIFGLNIPINMADNVVDVTPEQQQAEAAKAELAQHMGLALGTLKPSEVQQQAAPTGQEQVQAPADPFGIFKEKFGYDTPETAIKDIEELRAYKATPIVPELKFENEESARIVKALQAGKHAEVYSILDQQIKIDRLVEGEITAEKAVDVVKLGMQIKYKDLTPQEIDYKFNKQFGAPPKPALLPAEDQEEYDERLKVWQAVVDDKKMELMIEAKLAKPELQNSKQKLVFPEIVQQQDPNYAQYLKMLADNDKAAEEATTEYKKLTPKSVETRLNFNDEANKIAFEFQYEPSAEDFNKAVQMTVDEKSFWNLFNNPDGTPNRQKFLRVINYAINEEKVLMEAIKQAKNATIKASLPDNSQAGGLVRQLVTAPGEESEIDKQMRQRGIKR